MESVSVAAAVLPPRPGLLVWCEQWRRGCGLGCGVVSGHRGDRLSAGRLTGPGVYRGIGQPPRRGPRRHGTRPVHGAASYARAPALARRGAVTNVRKQHGLRPVNGAASENTRDTGPARARFSRLSPGTDLGPVRSIFVDQPGASGAVDRKAEDRPRTGRTWPTPTTRRGAVPGIPGPRRSAGQGLGKHAIRRDCGSAERRPTATCQDDRSVMIRGTWTSERRRRRCFPSGRETRRGTNGVRARRRDGSPAPPGTR